MRFIVEKIKYNRPLSNIFIPVNRRALVIGGGIAGIQAALDIADGGREVILVEKESSIGGHMSQLSETFPTLDCSQCILTPRMVEVAQHPRIKLLAYSEVESVDGYIGNFEVKIRQKARSIDVSKCNGCGECTKNCPNKKIPSEFEQGLGFRTAIYVPFPQAVPNIPVLDRDNCALFQGRAKGVKKQVCGKCATVCGRRAIDFDQQDSFITEKVGAIIVATGYQLYWIGKEQESEILHGYGEYGYGRFLTSLTGCSLSVLHPPRVRQVARSCGLRTARSLRRSSFCSASAPGTVPREWSTVRRSAACMSPNIRCFTITRFTTAKPSSFTWTSGPGERGMTNSFAARSKRATRFTCAAVFQA